MKARSLFAVLLLTLTGTCGAADSVVDERVHLVFTWLVDRQALAYEPLLPADAMQLPG